MLVTQEARSDVSAIFERITTTEIMSQNVNENVKRIVFVVILNLTVYYLYMLKKLLNKQLFLRPRSQGYFLEV